MVRFSAPKGNSLCPLGIFALRSTTTKLLLQTACLPSGSLLCPCGATDELLKPFGRTGGGTATLSPKGRRSEPCMLPFGQSNNFVVVPFGFAPKGQRTTRGATTFPSGERTLNVVKLLFATCCPEGKAPFFIPCGYTPFGQLEGKDVQSCLLFLLFSFLCPGWGNKGQTRRGSSFTSPSGHYRGQRQRKFCGV